MNAGQYEGLMMMLREIKNRMPEPATVHHLDDTKTVVEDKLIRRDSTPTTNRKMGARVALLSVLNVLDGWIEGARSNHDALGHSMENRGEECWTRFHPSDIRRMVNDAAREMGIAEFDQPKNPEEDKGR